MPVRFARTELRKKRDDLSYQVDGSRPLDGRNYHALFEHIFDHLTQPAQSGKSVEQRRAFQLMPDGVRLLQILGIRIRFVRSGCSAAHNLAISSAASATNMLTSWSRSKSSLMRHSASERRTGASLFWVLYYAILN